MTPFRTVLRRAVLAAAAPLLCALAPCLPATSACAAAVSLPQALRLLDAGRAEGAGTLLDSLLLKRPADGVLVYWRARAAELGGQDDLARCRYLACEAMAPGTAEASLAGARRRALEQRLAESILSLGLDRPGTSSSPTNLILLTPPDNLGASGQGRAWGLAWTYLLSEAFGGSRLCPVSMPVMLTVLDLLESGHVVRATGAARDFPVNTMAGLRARLALLDASDGQPYIRGTGEQDEQLSVALKQFQRDHRLPPTGEADVATQAQLGQAVEDWLRRAPPPLEPKLLGRAADVTGAALLLRGTYRIESGRVSVQLTLLDRTVAMAPASPISMVFPLEESAAKALEVAQVLLGEPVSSPQRGDISPQELEEAALSLLLADRGMPELAEQRWHACPQRWFDWPLLAAARRSVELGPAEVERYERGLRGVGPGEPPLLDAGMAQELFLNDLSGSWPRPAPSPGAKGGQTPVILEPGPYQIVGREGLLHIRRVSP